MRQKVLIVSVTPQTGEVLEQTFAGLSHSVSVKSVQSAQDALSWIQQRPIDLLVVEEGFKRSELEALGFALWSGNPAALAYITTQKDALDSPKAFYKVLGFHPFNREEFLQAVLEIQPSGKSGGATSPSTDFPVLVVEDLDSPRDIICIFIESLGFPVVHGCSSANEALKLLESDPTRFRCVITDIRMPNISGKEFIEIVRSHPRLRHLPIIVLTAYGTLDTLVDCLRLGASGFLIKPPKKDDMLRELSRARRIADQKESPRLASHQEAEYIRKLVEEQKVT